MINNQEELRQTANQLAAKGKGLLAVDESTPTIGKRLAGINVENTEENRQAYRGMLFTSEGLGQFISGVILFEETLYQNHVDGEAMVSKINKLGIIPGIKVDKGLSPLAGARRWILIGLTTHYSKSAPSATRSCRKEWLFEPRV